MIKKILSIIIITIMMMLSIFGCSSVDVTVIEKEESTVNSLTETNGDNSEEKLKVVTTIFPQYDFARAVGGEKIDLKMLLHPGTESHSYEPTPQDIITIQECDIFIYVGGESENWVVGILNSMDTSNMKIISLMDIVETLDEEIVEGMQEDYEHEEEHSHEDSEYDEHVWTSPVNAIIIIEEISKSFIKMDVENTEFYKNNADNYIMLIDEINTEFKEIVKHGNRNNLIFADRFPFRYFVETYGLEYSAAFPGCSVGTEVNAATIAFLINKVKTEQIPVVITIEFSNEKIADVIAEETGVKKVSFHSAHNVSKDDFEAGITYVDIMQNNIEALGEALK
jgi:ABC-type metal ion transport system, periplasmic component/surface adhesin